MNQEERSQVFVTKSIDDISDASEVAELQIRDNLTGKKLDPKNVHFNSPNHSNEKIRRVFEMER